MIIDAFTRSLIFSAKHHQQRQLSLPSSSLSLSAAAVSSSTRIFRRHTSTKSSKERLRVAVVGGGAAGLAAALHLAPLVTQGLIGGPIDIYDSEERPSNREIGIGIWSTALDCFQKDSIDSHQLVYNDMIKHGTFVQEVGYRSPNGSWLAESSLKGDSIPDLIFLREKDMLASLRKAVHLEVNRGNVMLYTGSNHKVHSIMEDSTTEAWSAPLMLQPDGPDSPLERTERDYHLIVAGTSSF
jgi:Fe-S cluster assembly iron-binding protein IscA